MNLCEAIQAAIKVDAAGVHLGRRAIFFGKGKFPRLMVATDGDVMPIWEDDFVTDGWRPIE